MAAKAKALMAHPRRERIVFDPSVPAFIVFNSPIHFHGLHALLRTLVPNYEYKDAVRVRGPRYGKRATRPNVANEAQFRQYLKVSACLKGLEGGILVHREISEAINSRSPQPSRDPRTRMLWAKLTEDGVSPVANGADFPLFDEDLKYATAADFLAVHGDRLYVVEIKTARSVEAFEGAPGRMSAPLNKIFAGNSARDQALAQALIPCLTLAKHYKIIAFPLVYCLTDGEAHRFSLPTDRLPPKFYDGVHAALVKHVKENARAKTKKQFIRKRA